MKISVNKLKLYIQIILDCSLCIGAYFLWINSLSFITSTYLIGACLLSFLLNYRNSKILRIKKTHFIWVAYILSVFFNVFLSTDVSKSLSFAKVLVSMIVVTLTFSEGKSNSKIAGKLVIVLSVCLSLSVIWEFIDYDSFRNVAMNLFSTDLYIEISKLRGSFNRYVGFGVYSGPAACLIIYGICAALAYLKKRVAFYIILGISLIAILLTGSRTLLILIAIVWICYQLYMKTLAEKKITATRIFIYFAALVAICYVMYNFILKNSSNLRLLDGSATNASVNTRFELYRYAIFLFIRNPIFGTGINTFLNYSTLNSSLENTYTHNLILQSLAEQGLIGCVLLISSIAATFIHVVNKWKSGVKTNSMKFSILTQIVFIVYSMVGNPFYDINLRLIYFFAVMIGLRESSETFLSEDSNE